MSARVAVHVLSLALTVAVAAPALAADNPQDAVRARLSEGEQRYQDQEYRAAIEAFGAVVKDPVATRDQRARAYEYLGMSWLILGKKPRAREAFEELLAIDPHYTLSDPTHSPSCASSTTTCAPRSSPATATPAARRSWS